MTKEKGVNPKLAAFARWRSTPVEEREFKTQREFCKHLGISEQTAVAWGKQLDRMGMQTDEAQVSLFLKKVWEGVLKGTNPQWARLYWELINPDKGKRSDGIELDAAAYNRIATETTKRLRDNYKQRGGICPVCGQHEISGDTAHMDTEPEHAEDREVAAVAIPSGLN